MASKYVECPRKERKRYKDQMLLKWCRASCPYREKCKALKK